ncbi:MAG: sulfur carrier protein ThiS [bacterium]|nr:sulfur carrier protein ThiS [bacterium]
MKIILNGQIKEIDIVGAALHDLLRTLAIPTEATAVAVNNDIIPRSTWNKKQVQENDSIEIIRAVGGG